jgi:hypothetical protein
VETSEAPLAQYVPPEGIDRRGALGTQTKRRLYDIIQGKVEDFQLHRKRDWTERHLVQLLREITEEHLLQSAQALVEA